MLILKEKKSFIERYNHLLTEILHPKVIYIDKQLIWRKFCKNLGINHLRLTKIKHGIPEILENLSNNEIYHVLVKSCGSIIKELL